MDKITVLIAYNYSSINTKTQINILPSEKQNIEFAYSYCLSSNLVSLYDVTICCELIRKSARLFAFDDNVALLTDIFLSINHSFVSMRPFIKERKHTVAMLSD